MERDSRSRGRGRGRGRGGFGAGRGNPPEHQQGFAAAGQFSNGSYTKTDEMPISPAVSTRRPPTNAKQDFGSMFDSAVGFGASNVTSGAGNQGFSGALDSGQAFGQPAGGGFVAPSTGFAAPSNKKTVDFHVSDGIPSGRASEFPGPTHQGKDPRQVGFGEGSELEGGIFSQNPEPAAGGSWDAVVSAENVQNSGPVSSHTVRIDAKTLERTNKPQAGSTPEGRATAPNRPVREVFVYNLPPELRTQQAVREHFLNFLPAESILAIKIIKTHALVVFKTPEEATRAFRHGRLYGPNRVVLQMRFATQKKQEERQGAQERTSALEEEQKPLRVQPGRPKDEFKEPGPVARPRLKQSANAEDENLASLNSRSQRFRDDTAAQGQPREEPKRTTGTTRWDQGQDKRKLSEAKALVGTCLDMCPEKERYDREIQRDLFSFEILAGTENPGPGEYPRVDHNKAVKKYARSAAFAEEATPEMVRPPSVLKQVMEYLLTKIVDRDDVSFVEIHNFLRDRTRSIRQDFTYQGIRDALCIDLHEQAVRFHIDSEHRLCEEDAENFSSKQNLEQLDKCLISLREMYREHREENPDLSFEFEPEIQSYFATTHCDPRTICGLMKELPFRVTSTAVFATTVSALSAMHRNDYFGFFRVVTDAPYLSSCLLHTHFTPVRNQALQQMRRAYKGRDNALPVEECVDLLGFNDHEEAEAFCTHHGFVVATSDSGKKEIDFSVQPVSVSEERWQPRRSTRLVESKCKGYKVSSIIRGVLTTEERSSQKQANNSTLSLRHSMRTRDKLQSASVPASAKLSDTNQAVFSFSGSEDKLQRKTALANPDISVVMPKPSGASFAHTSAALPPPFPPQGQNPAQTRKRDLDNGAQTRRSEEEARAKKKAAERLAELELLRQRQKAEAEKQRQRKLAAEAAQQEAEAKRVAEDRKKQEAIEKQRQAELAEKRAEERLRRLQEEKQRRNLLQLSRLFAELLKFNNSPVGPRQLDKKRRATKVVDENFMRAADEYRLLQLQAERSCAKLEEIIEKLDKVQISTDAMEQKRKKLLKLILDTSGRLEKIVLKARASETDCREHSRRRQAVAKALRLVPSVLSKDQNGSSPPKRVQTPFSRVHDITMKFAEAIEPGEESVDNVLRCEMNAAGMSELLLVVHSLDDNATTWVQNKLKWNGSHGSSPEPVRMRLVKRLEREECSGAALLIAGKVTDEITRSVENIGVTCVLIVSDVLPKIRFPIPARHSPLNASSFSAGLRWIVRTSKRVELRDIRSEKALGDIAV
uniref:RRM domain-containing protein n=2 Tax=Rhodosorus marinus TaxID=101924 RepID=A0A7S2ZHY5_9RHOD|mmetsp:Transcript_20192/g.81157  ORF Transcript_20192/g.81157 Transcript_20192/m.81157 type:complete len:1275 (+) Transcript_20192:431-4255(+)